MEGRTINDLFTELINRRGIHRQLGIPAGTIRTLRARNAGTGECAVAYERKAELLRAAGYTITQPELWAQTA